VAWLHAIVIAYATGFDSASATTATCLRCRKGSAEPDIDRCDTKRSHARSERYRGKSHVGKARCGIFPSKVSITVNARGRAMGFSCRTFLIARDDTLWRLSSTKFDRMLRDPAGHCLPDFAGQRARMASVVVELVARNPMRVVRNTFSILTFDAEGRIDPSRFEKQQFALAESTFAPVFTVFADESNKTIVDATSRFIAQGGQWVPSRALARIIDQTAVGQRQCRHL
jgi:hypothetical protein